MFDFIVLGGGILGLSTAWQLQQCFPNKLIAVLEKESQLACHQTGHNSGVFINTRRSLNVCNASSPAATSAIPIAAHIIDQLVKKIIL